MKKAAVLLIIIVMIAFLFKVYFDTNDFKVNTVQFETEKLPMGAEWTVLQISDLHSKVFDNDNEKLINTVEKLNADIIVLTGDLIDRDTNNFQHVFNLIEKLTEINPDIFFVSGNHEWGNAKTEAFLNGLQKRGVTMLNNSHTQITTKNLTVNVAGVDDVSTNHENVDKAFDNMNQESYTILLSHSPGITEKYDDISADLILSGHTHGGQVRLPFIGALVAPDQGLFPKFDKGIYTFGQNQHLYIDSGLGTSVAPIRFLNKSQLSLIKIANGSRGTVLVLPPGHREARESTAL